MLRSLCLSTILSLSLVPLYAADPPQEETGSPFTLNFEVPVPKPLSSVTVLSLELPKPPSAFIIPIARTIPQNGTRPDRAFVPGNNVTQSAPPWAQATDGPNLKDFPKQFLLNLKGLFSRQNLWPLLIGVGATATATAFDDGIKDFFYGHERLEEMGEVGSIIGNRFVVAGMTGGLLISGYFSQDTRHRSMMFTLAQGYAVATTVTAAVKVTARRLRPNGENRVSFPSGHTSTVFTWATVLDHYYGRKVAIPAYLVATFVGISRMESSHHFLSDVVAGAALGYIVGRTVIRGTQSLEQKRRLTWSPMIAPDNVGLSLAIGF